MDTLSILISFFFGVLASIVAAFLIQPIYSLFLPHPDKWEGKWIGTAEDIPIEGEEDLDSRGNLTQDVKIKVVRTGKEFFKVNGTISGAYNTKNGEKKKLSAILKGKGNIYDGNYATVSYTLFFERSVGFGVALFQISRIGKKISGHFLSRRIAEEFSVSPRAFGKIHLNLIENEIEQEVN